MLMASGQKSQKS